MKMNVDDHCTASIKRLVGLELERDYRVVESTKEWIVKHKPFSNWIKKID